MPALTEIQSYAAGLMRSLLCMRHEQIHWMIRRKYSFVTPERIMRQLCHVLRIYNDGEYYLWPGIKPNPERADAVDVMLMLCKGCLPILGDAPRYPCALLFFIPVPKSHEVLPCRIYIPRRSDEEKCQVIAESEQQPKDHTVIFLISDKNQASLLQVSHRHIFAQKKEDGTYMLWKPEV